MTNDEKEQELNESDMDQNEDSEKEPDYNYAREMRERVTKIDQIEKRKGDEKRDTALTDEIRKKSTVNLAPDVIPFIEQEKELLSPSKELRRKKKVYSGPIEKLKPSNVKRELIPFIIIAVITFSSLIYFSYQDSSGSIEYSADVPIINIQVSSEITNYSQQCFIKFSPISYEFIGANWAERNLLATIRKRNSDGGFSFELFQRENLFQIRDDDDWLLLPPGKNLDSLRIKMAFDVYNMLKENDPDYLLPDSKLAEVHINGVYKGLYLLSERIDRKLMNLQQENDMIFKINNWDGDFFTIPNITNSPWEQLHPDTADYSQIPVNLTHYIHDTSEVDFFNEGSGIFSIFDKGEIIDNLLFGLLTGHEIIEGSSYYLIYNQRLTPGFFFLPWDFGQSWGFSKYGSIPKKMWLNEFQNEINSICWSKLYHRLLFPSDSSINDGFELELKNRWNYIRSNLWNGFAINEYLDNLYSTILNTLYRTTTGNVYDIKYAIESWLSTRFSLLDIIFNGPDPIFNDNFQLPFREDNEIFGFSNPSARRHYFKSSQLFSTEKIHDIDVVIQDDYFLDMIYRKKDDSRWTERIYMPANVTIDDYSMDNTGFRIRGNYNRWYPKDSFKLKFSETELYLGDGIYKNFPENENRRFLGLRRLNLRAAPTDFSLMNEVTGYEIYKILGYPCPRVSWGRLYITETDTDGNIVKPREYNGMYLITEDIDKTFLNYNFKNPNGNLYKTSDIPASLEYKADLKNYKTYDGRRIYELRTNEIQDDYSDLEEFIFSINFNWGNIQDVANMTLLAKYFAVSNFIGNWDDYVFLPHNYFLYSDPNYGFVFLPWDIEMSLNMLTNLSIVGYWNEFHPYFTTAPLLSGYKGYFDWISEWAQIDPDPRPLWDNLITDSDFITPYLNSHQMIVNNMTSLIEQIELWFDFIQPTAISPFQYTDPYPHPIGDWIMDFQIEPNPLNWFNYEKIRVLTFLEGRTQFVINQLP